VRAALQESLDALEAFRATQWRGYGGSLAEVVFDRAYCELVLCKQWLGEQLGRLAAEKTAPQTVANG